MSELIIGSREILKQAQNGKISKIMLASNCPANIKNDMEKTGIEVEIFSGNEKELGIKAGKPFPVAAVGYMKSDEK